MKNFLKVFIGLIVGGVCLFYAFKGQDWSSVLINLEQAHLYWIALSFLSFCLALLTRAQRWDCVLRPSTPALSKATSFKVFLVCMAANAILPLRLGDLMRGTVFAKSLKMPPIKAITGVFLEKLFDLTVICSAGAALFYFYPVKNAGIMRFGSSALLGITLFVLAILLGAHYLRNPISFVLKTISKKAPVTSKIIGFIETQMHHVCDALLMINTKVAFAQIVFWSVLTWFFEGATFYIVAKAFPSVTNTIAAWVAMPISALSTALPGGPGGAGAFDLCAKQIMHLWGNTNDASAAFTIILHLVIFLSQVSLGAIAWTLGSFLSERKTSKN